MEMIKRFFKDESGATMVEYAVLAALIAVFAIGVIYTVGEKVQEAFEKTRDCLVTPETCPEPGD